jgi:hypothetical protein
MAVDNSKEWPSFVVFGSLGIIVVLLCTTGYLFYINSNLHEHVDDLDHSLHEAESKAQSLQVKLDGCERQRGRDAAISEQSHNDYTQHIGRLEQQINTLTAEKSDLNVKLSKAWQDHAEAQAAAAGSGATASELSQCLLDYKSMQEQYAAANQNAQTAQQSAAMWKRHYDDEVARHSQTVASLHAATTQAQQPPPVPPQPAVQPVVPPTQPPNPVIPRQPPIQPPPAAPQPVVPPPPRPQLIPPPPPIPHPEPLPTAGSATGQGEQYVVNENFV